MRYTQKKHRRYGTRLFRPLLISGAVLLLGAAIYAYAIRSDSSSSPEEATTQQNQTQQQDNSSEQPDRVEGAYLLTGTIVPARGVEQFARRSDGSIDFQQPFSQLHTLQPEAYDAWVTDLECPITDADLSFRQQVETLVFNCRPGFVEPIVQYFEIINLANNHSSDQGQAAFVETQKRLEEAGSQVFGHYDSSENDDVCQVIGLPVRVQQANGTETSERLPVAFCGWHYFTRDPVQEELAVMDRYAELMPVFAFTHAGAEYLAEARQPEVNLARSLIDRGAEFVINNNPHWVQNTEVYNDRLIVYSTGNFIFDQLDEETNRAANIDVSISVDYDDTVQQWLDLGESCIGRNTDCLAEAQRRGLQKITPEYTFDVVASLNGYQEITRRADSETQRRVEARMNWQQTLQQLGQTTD